jgi:5-methylcytosine-specific restriction protein A
MATYLLTWNPERWQWDDIQDDIALITEKGFCDGRWSSGVTKKIQPSDRIFLMKLGSQKPRGIMASGWATSEVFQDIHWGDDSKLAHYVDIHFDTIIDPSQDDIFSVELLQDEIYSGVNWTPQACLSRSSRTLEPIHAAQWEEKKALVDELYSRCSACFVLL